MCVITDINNKVLSVSLIPGLNPLPNGAIMYFPWMGNPPSIGDILDENVINLQQYKQG